MDLVVHFQSVFSRHDIHAFAIGGRAMLAIRSLAGTFNLVGATLKLVTHR